MLIKTYSLWPHCVFCWTTYILQNDTRTLQYQVWSLFLQRTPLNVPVHKIPFLLHDLRLKICKQFSFCTDDKAASSYFRACALHRHLLCKSRRFLQTFPIRHQFRPAILHWICVSACSTLPSKTEPVTRKLSTYVVGSKRFRPDIQKPRQMENAVRDI